MPTQTPWGPSQGSTRLAPGIISYSTAGHGGIHLSPTRNAEMPVYLRNDSGWYEEDCEWAKVAIVFPDAFKAFDQVEGAKKIVKNYLPFQYEKFYGVVLQPGESREKDDQAFYKAHEHDFLVNTAWGDWREGVPKGFVLVLARRTKKLFEKMETTEEAYFLVPADEYETRYSDSKSTAPAFVIDETRHKRTVNPETRQPAIF